MHSVKKNDYYHFLSCFRGYNLATELKQFRNGTVNSSETEHTINDNNNYNMSKALKIKKFKRKKSQLKKKQ